MARTRKQKQSSLEDGGVLPNLKNPTNAEGTTVIVTGAFWEDEPDKEKWFPCEVLKFNVFCKLN